MDLWLASDQFKPQTWLISGWFQYIIFSLQSCNSGSPILNCVPIRCTLLGLSGSSSTQIDITSRLDERFFSVSSQIARGRDTEREGEGGRFREGGGEREMSESVRVRELKKKTSMVYERYLYLITDQQWSLFIHSDCFCEYHNRRSGKYIHPAQ